MIGRVIGTVCFFLTTIGFSQSASQYVIPLAPEQNRRPVDFQSFFYKYDLEGLMKNYSKEMMNKAAVEYKKMADINNKGKWKATPESIDSHQTPEWYDDAKFGMFIDWGLWSVAGWGPKNTGKAMYPDWYEFRMYTDSVTRMYHIKNWGEDFGRDDFIPLFTAKAYDPEKLVKIAFESGMKYIIPFSKHHTGFCLWPSSFTHRDAVDMGPKKDLIMPLVEQCREQGLKFGFYFSTEEWEYPVINDEGKIVNRLWGGKIEPYSKELEKKSSGKIAVRNFFQDYIIPQATEFIDRYDPDILWYDGEWNTSVYDLRSYDISAYFYNKAEGRKEVAVNDRYGLENGKRLRFVRGDIFTSEFHDNDDKIKIHSWEANRGISQSFGYNWQDNETNVITSKEFIDMFVDIVARGGNLLLIVNLDGQGAMPGIQENRLKDIGKWLKVNGEGIYSTRPFTRHFDGTTAYTRSKDNKYIYAILKEWPGSELNLKGIAPEKGSKIQLLGYDKPLKWKNSDQDVIIKLPAILQDISNRPCSHAWILKIKLSSTALQNTGNL